MTPEEKPCSLSGSSVPGSIPVEFSEACKKDFVDRIVQALKEALPPKPIVPDMRDPMEDISWNNGFKDGANWALRKIYGE